MKMVLDISKLPSQENRQFIFLTPQDLRLVSTSVSQPIRIIFRGLNSCND